jgi:hypothetical protein
LTRQKINKITFNEFALGLTPSLRPPKIEDLPRIISYSPRKEALSKAPKFNEIIENEKGPKR